MKYLVVWLLSSMALNSMAQTKEETKAWLEAKIAASFYEPKHEVQISVSEKYTFGAFVVYANFWAASNIPAEKQTIIWKNITDVVWFSAHMDDGAYIFKIKIVGKGEKESISQEGWATGKKSDIGFIEIILRNTVSKDDLGKLVKALKHMATLHGAALVKDDMF